MVRRLISHSNIERDFKKVDCLSYPGKKIEDILDILKEDESILQVSALNKFIFEIEAIIT